MSSILYYSNYCEHSKKLLQSISKSQTNDIHFICIDNRVKEGPKTYILLNNGNKILFPETVSRVPALLLLTQGYKVIYGDDISHYFKPREEINVKQATQNNMEPMAFAFNSGGFGDIVSDQYSFLDMDANSLTAEGDGGLRQMHNYVDLNMSNTQTFNCPQDEQDYKKSNKLPENVTIENLQQQREMELKKLSSGNRQIY